MLKHSCAEAGALADVNVVRAIFGQQQVDARCRPFCFGKTRYVSSRDISNADRVLSKTGDYRRSRRRWDLDTDGRDGAHAHPTIMPCLGQGAFTRETRSACQSPGTVPRNDAPAGAWSGISLPRPHQCRRRFLIVPDARLGTKPRQPLLGHWSLLPIAPRTGVNAEGAQQRRFSSSLWPSSSPISSPTSASPGARCASAPKWLRRAGTDAWRASISATSWTRRDSRRSPNVPGPWP